MYIKGIICTKGGKGLHDGGSTPVGSSGDRRGVCIVRASSVPVEEEVCMMVVQQQWEVVGMGGVCVQQGHGLYQRREMSV